MNKESIAMIRPSLPGPRPVAPGSRPASERGQMLVIFALALVALIGMVGLIIDGGDTFLQRRDQQNVADAAAMAAGYASVNGQDPTAAAQAVATANGYENGQGGTTVTVTVGSSAITVDVSRPHQNYFAGAMGFASWGVSTTASVQAGIPNGAYGAMPIIFNEAAFNEFNQKNVVNFDEPPSGSSDVPQTETTFNWTVFCTANGNPCNGDSNTVNDIINDRGTTTTIYTDFQIGPLNAGSHTTLFDSLAAMVPGEYPVAIVANNGGIKGWAMFRLTGSVGGSTKQISGTFSGPKNDPPMVITQGHSQAAGVYGYVVKLTN
jgi:hypothetical protein